MTAIVVRNAILCALGVSLLTSMIVWFTVVRVVPPIVTETVLDTLRDMGIR